MKKIILNDIEIAKVLSTFNNDLKTYDDFEGCLCCNFICDLSDDKSIFVKSHCRKSGNCPDGKQWNFDEIIVYGQRLISEKYEGSSIFDDPDVEEDKIKVLGILNEEQTIEIYKILNKKIAEEFTTYNRDGLYPNEIKLMKKIDKFDNDLIAKCDSIKKAISFLNKEDQLKILNNVFGEE